MFRSDSETKLDTVGPETQSSVPAGGYKGPASTAASGVLKRTLASPLALSAIITYTLAVLCDVINTANVLARVLTMFYEFCGPPEDTMGLREGGALPAATESAILTAFFVLLAIVVILWRIAEILTAVGMWTTYVSSARRLSLSPKTGGLNIARVGCLGFAVSFCILTAAVDLYLIGLTFILGGLFWEIMLIVDAIMVLIILLYLKSARLVKDFTDTALTGIAPETVPAFVPVMSILMGGLTFFAYFLRVFRGDVLTCISYMCSAAFILFGVLLLLYRRAVVSSAGTGCVPVPQGGCDPQAEPAAPKAEQQLVTCAKCGSQYSAEYNICPYCGQPKQ